MFKAKVSFTAFDDRWKNWCDRYQNVKLNHLSFYVSIGYYTWDIEHADKKTNYPVAGGIKYFSSIVPFKLNWDLDRYLDDNLDPTTMFDDSSFKSVWLNSKKNKSFKYTPPSILKTYRTCNSMRDLDGNKSFAENIKDKFGIENIRIPKYWYGGFGKQWIENLPGLFLNPTKPSPQEGKGIPPIMFVLRLRAYLNVTFRGNNNN